MIDPKKIITWCGVPAAIVAMVMLLGGLIDARAQDTARVEVDRQMAPVQQQLAELVDQGRRDEDFKLRIYCMDRQHRDMDANARELKCDAESDARWTDWKLKDAAQLSKEPD